MNILVDEHKIGDLRSSVLVSYLPCSFHSPFPLLHTDIDSFHDSFLYLLDPPIRNHGSIPAG